MFVFRLSEWHWQLSDSSGYDTHLSKQCNGQTSIPHSAYGIIRSDAASKHHSASTRPSTVIIAQTDLARLSYVCWNVFAMSSILFFFFFWLRIRSNSLFNGELRPRNAFAISFFALTRIPCAAVIFRMELFSLLRFIRLYIFPMHDLTRASTLIRNTAWMGSVSRLQRAKELYITGNGGHVHIEMALDNHSPCHRTYAKWASWTWTRFSFMAMSLNSKPNYFASWPWRCWRIIILLISTHQIGPALYHAFYDPHIRSGWSRTWKLFILFHTLHVRCEYSQPRSPYVQWKIKCVLSSFGFLFFFAVNTRPRECDKVWHVCALCERYREGSNFIYSWASKNSPYRRQL